MDALLSPVALGVGMGLIVGKALEITRFKWNAVRLRSGLSPKAPLGDT